MGAGTFTPIFVASWGSIDLDVTTRLIMGAANRLTFRVQSARHHHPHPALTAGLTITYADGTTQKSTTGRILEDGSVPAGPGEATRLEADRRGRSGRGGRGHDPQRNFIRCAANFPPSLGRLFCVKVSP